MYPSPSRSNTQKAAFKSSRASESLDGSRLSCFPSCCFCCWPLTWPPPIKVVDEDKDGGDDDDEAGDDSDDFNDELKGEPLVSGGEPELEAQLDDRDLIRAKPLPDPRRLR